MAKISKEFTYDLPDEYTKQTSDLGLTATATYEGPEFLYVFVDAATGRLLGNQLTNQNNKNEKSLFSNFNHINYFYYFLCIKKEPCLLSRRTIRSWFTRL